MGLKMNFLKWVVSRLKEPSTMAGISCVGVVLGLPPGTLDIAAQIVIGAAGVAAVLFPETK